MFFSESRVCEKNIKYCGKRIAISKNIRYTYNWQKIGLTLKKYIKMED